MKFLVFGLALLAGASAFSDVQGRQSEGEIFLENFKMAIKAFQRYIVRNELDPLIARRIDSVISHFPYLKTRVFIERVDFRGISNIVIHRLEYSNIFSRFRFDLELPALEFTIGDSGISGTFLTSNISAKLAGNLSITNVRLAGEAYVKNNLLTGEVTITELETDFSIGGIKSDITIQFLDSDYSDCLNTLLNDTIPEFLEDNEDEINIILANVIRTVAQMYWT